MSATIDLEPPPILLGAMSPNDQDGAWGIDATTNMTRRGSTITAVATPIVTRLDGVAIDGGDLTVSDQAVLASPTTMWTDQGQVTVAAGYGWTFNAQTHGNLGDYSIEFPLTLANGDTISRFATIPVIARPG